MDAMKTCANCSHRGNRYEDEGESIDVCQLTGERVSLGREACKEWDMDTLGIHLSFVRSLAKAREKHPVFLDAWPKAEDAETYLDTAEIHKLDIGKKKSTQLHSILFSEVFEFLAEIARGDFDRALEEAGDVIAVLYRALNGDGKEEEANDRQ